MLVSLITFFDQKMALACDARCDKAWGINGRPRVQLSADIDDYYWLADDELGIAPEDPGTYEGDHAKPERPSHNKWCARECERSILVDGRDCRLKDFSKRIYNIPQSGEAV